MNRIATEYRQERLARQLANDEPKCATCAQWQRDKTIPEFGACGRILALASKDEELAQGILTACGSTTDLSVCSKWEPKV